MDHKSLPGSRKVPDYKESLFYMLNVYGDFPYVY